MSRVLTFAPLVVAGISILGVLFPQNGFVCAAKARKLSAKEKVLFDFTTMDNLNNWVEVSDPVRQVGMSKASFVLQKTQVFQRAVLFTLLNPQPNGAGFAGYKTDTNWNLSDYSKIQVRLRAQGQNFGYKVVLRHKWLNSEPHPTYEQMFEAPQDFSVVELPLDKFEAYYRGLKNDTAEPLDKSDITSFGFQMYGGVYLPTKQKGVSALEIDWVKVV